MTIHLVQGMPEVGLASRSQDAPQVDFVLIHPKTLIAESLVSGLRTHDGLATYRFHPSVVDWRDSGNPVASLVLIYISVLSRDPEAELNQSVDALVEHGSGTSFVVVSDIEDAAFVIHCMNKGSSGFIPTNLTLAVAVQALHLVLAGGHFVPWTALLRLSERPVAAIEPTPRLQVLLSTKEAQVARELRKGTPNKIIAYNLNMCESTVKVHVRNIMRKLNAKNRTEVAYFSNELMEASRPP